MARRVIDPETGRTAPAIHDLHAVGGMGHGAVTQRVLVAQLVRLKWTLWKRSFSKNIGKLIGTIVGVLYGLGGLVGLALALGAAALLVDDAGPDAFGLLMRGLGALLVVTWLVFPLFAFGLDDTLDPRRFATLPRTARELQPGLLAAAAVSLPTLFTVLGILIASVCEVLWLVTARPSGTGPLVAAGIAMVPANLLGLVLCLLLPRAIMAHSATRRSSRRGRELGGVIAMVAMVGAIYGASLLSQSLAGADIARYLGILRSAVGIAAWTPLGAPFAVPIDLAEGALLTALARLLVTLVAIAAVWLWWRRSIDRSLRSALVGDSSSGMASVTALVPRWAPQKPLGASIGRSLRYWRRDARYLAAIGLVPIMTVFFTGMGLISPMQAPIAVGGVVLVAGLSSASICNELGYDGPAGWVQITAGMTARENLLGRVIALACFAVPFAVLSAVVVPLLTGVADLIPLALLGSLGVMMGAWGVSLLVAVIVPYPASPPGTNPLNDRSASSANAMIASFGAMFGMWVPQLLAIGLAIWGLVVGSGMIQLIAGIVSVLCGALAFWLGLRIASGILDRRYVDLFQKVRVFV